MENYKRSRHTVWDCKYHLVWTTKYRYQVLGGEVGLRCRELLREIAISKEMQIYAGCSGQLVPDSKLSLFSAIAGASPSFQLLPQL